MSKPGNDDANMQKAGTRRGLSVKLTPCGEELHYLLESLERMEQEATRLARWQNDLRVMGKLAAADALSERIEEIERHLLYYS